MRAVAARAAGGGFFQMCRMRCAVGTQEELLAAAGRRLHQGQAVGFALQNRQAVKVRTHAAQEDGVAVEQQVLGRDGGSQKVIGRSHVLGRLLGRHVFHDDLEFREIFAQGLELLLNEHCLAVEQVDAGVGHFTMHQQHQAFALHGFECGVDLAQIGHTVVGVGGGTGGVQLASDHASRLGAHDFVGREVVRQVQRHQGLKLAASGHGRQNALAVSHGQFGRRHGRLEVGHDDGAAHLAGAVRHHAAHGIAIAHVQVPVIGAGNGEGGGGSHAAIVPLTACQQGCKSCGHNEKHSHLKTQHHDQRSDRCPCF